MKLFIKKECPHCKNLETQDISNLKIIEVDNSEYQGLTPGSVPVLEMNDGIQIWDGTVINSVFYEIRKRI